jgi:hypothetical protein
MATSAERLQQYEDLFEKSQAYDPAKFQQDFERAYGEATNYNQDLINQQSQALGNLQTVAPELRQKYSQTLIKDPTLQRSLIAQARQAPITDYSNAVNLLGQRGQRYADILQSSLGGYQTAAERAQTAAENAWRMYQDQRAQEEAARARAAAAASRGPSLQEILASLGGGGGQGGGEPTYEIPEDTYGTASLGNSNQDRLTSQVLKMRSAQTPGELIKSYADTYFIEPYRNINSIGDVLNVPAKGIAGATTVISDLFNRLKRR